MDKPMNKRIMGMLILLLGSCIALSGYIALRSYAAAQKKLATLTAVNNLTVKEAAPVATVHFSREQPASPRPFVTWSQVPGAIAYEIELYQADPSLPGSPPPFFTTSYIYVPGYNVALPEDYSSSSFYWRVRALNFDSQPISPFSAPEQVYVDPHKSYKLAPVPLSYFNKEKGSHILYPVYMWIPVTGAAQYEIEILDELPENPLGDQPSQHRIDAALDTGFDHYDENPRMSTKQLYWRVRALDEQGGPLGVFSPANPCGVNPDDQYIVATLGDSITHGGGSISYSPSNWEYDFQHYLDFPCVNLGRSGDTSASTLERFETDVIPFRPQYLLILTGTNSLRDDIPAQDVIDDLMTLEDKCLAANIQPIFLTLPPINPSNIKRAFEEPTVPDWQKKFAKVNAYIKTQPHIDVSAKFTTATGILPTELGQDGIHPDTEGKRLMAEAINQRWEKVSNIPPLKLRRSYRAFRP